jgi:hypothetical protein
MMHPSCTGVRKQQYPHRFRQAVVSGRKTFREKVIVRPMRRGSSRQILNVKVGQGVGPGRIARPGRVMRVRIINRAG